jgi:hypothetical protein
MVIVTALGEDAVTLLGGGGIITTPLAHREGIVKKVLDTEKKITGKSFVLPNAKQGEDCKCLLHRPSLLLHVAAVATFHRCTTHVAPPIANVTIARNRGNAGDVHARTNLSGSPHQLAHIRSDKEVSCTRDMVV